MYIACFGPLGRRLTAGPIAAVENAHPVGQGGAGHKVWITDEPITVGQIVHAARLLLSTCRLAHATANGRLLTLSRTFERRHNLPRTALVAMFA